MYSMPVSPDLSYQCCHCIFYIEYLIICPPPLSPSVGLIRTGGACYRQEAELRCRNQDNQIQETIYGAVKNRDTIAGAHARPR